MSCAGFIQLVIDQLEWWGRRIRETVENADLVMRGGEEESEETGLLPYDGLQEASTSTVLGKVSKEQRQQWKFVSEPTKTGITSMSSRLHGLG
jgi:hypothetical protein